jgi:hypothetical protein
MVWGVIGYFCNKTQYDPGTQQNGCTATGYDAFNCTKYIGLGASQKYISTLFGSTQRDLLS